MCAKYPIVKSKALAFFVASGVVFSVPQSADAREWNMCDWEEIPTYILKRIEKRPNFEDILDRMTYHCPDEAVSFTNWATASLSQNPPAYVPRTDATDVDNEDDLSLADNAGTTGADTSGSSTSTGGSTGGDSSTGGGGSSDGEGSSGSSSSSDGDGSSSGDSSSDSGGERGSNANNGGGNGSEGESPGKGNGANNDE